MNAKDKAPKKLSKKDLKLLEELRNRIREHKEEIVMYALLRVKNIYNTKYFKRYKNMEVKALTEEEDGCTNLDYECTKIYRVTEDLDKRNLGEEQGIYDKVYEYCWDRVKDLLKDDANMSAM